MSPKRARAKKKVELKLGRRSAADSGPGPNELAKIALDLFAERHFASVSIRDIGRAADVNSSMIYYHFKDKEDLFRAAIETAIDEAFQLFDTRCNSGHYDNPAQAIEDWFDIHVQLNKQLRNVIKISLDCKGVIGVPEADEPIKRFYRHEHEILRNYIREGIDQGLFRPVDPNVNATMISTILDGVMARSFFLEHFDLVGTVSEFKQALWDHLGYKAGTAKAVRAVKATSGTRKRA
jgi:AcrR family transcriptional regulator